MAALIAGAAHNWEAAVARSGGLYNLIALSAMVVCTSAIFFWLSAISIPRPGRPDQNGDESWGAVAGCFIFASTCLGGLMWWILSAPDSIR
ncbi:hypothetical protein GCM10009789_82960 [Kribbella sancticallisti]|uniref:Uncharacterized protein n=1 Tax=Kribbella sancticallisti TaxID=460087 RepID=A0ABN2ESX0_9ACTN